MAGFTAWLLSHKKQQTALGDLARDWSRDSERPRVRTQGALLTHLERRGACRGALDAARKAWCAYSAERGAPPPVATRSPTSW